MVIPDKVKWQQFHVDPQWGEKHVNLAYVNEQFNDLESLTEWKSLGYTQTKFTGDMYDMRNPEPDWMAGVRSHFRWQHFSWSVYRMGPGTALPEHQDTYDRFRKIYNVADPTKIYRAVIFLEDWHQGHYFDIDGVPITQWRAGDGAWWNWDTKHTAANVGKSNRYTLQITGLQNDNIIV
jgi:hypothetical protein